MAVLAMSLALAGCGNDDQQAARQDTTPDTRQDAAPNTRPAAADVDTDRIINADREPGNWMSYGRTYSEQRYSPLTQINDRNVGDLGIAWYLDLDTHRGQEATPIVVDGVMYTSTAWSKVKALDAATGKIIWEFDPEVPGQWAVNACCDVVNRGVAVYEGKVYVGTLDGRLIALDAETGQEVWSTQTFPTDKPYTITGAPRAFKGLVVIGNGGAEMGVRGFVSAYDADTGELVWRWYTVPGNPADGFENEAMEMAAKTWNGEWWKMGGGGTAWDSLVYDPETDLLFIGVGNGAPWNQAIRSPGGGDNLFLSSIVALKPETGEYVWHYQTTPGETWDYTATQQIMLADLEIDGQNRKVLMQAPKNGFFYVLDRATGELLSAKPFTDINWATGVDMETGRPIENPMARYENTGKLWVASPGPVGAHNWHPMAYNKNTGLVYIPVNDAGFSYLATKDFTPQKLGFNIGLDMVGINMPVDTKVRHQIMQGVRGHLLAWDPVAAREVWRVPMNAPANGGVLTTAGNLVVQGRAQGTFAAYAADTGKQLWSTDLQGGIIAAPMTYTVNGEQYVAILSGWGGTMAMAPGDVGRVSGNTRNVSRVVAFKLGGDVQLPALKPEPEPILDPPPSTASAEDIEKGRVLFHDHCGTCHGELAISAGLLPDLRFTPALHDDTWYDIVLGGALQANGMASFAVDLNREQVTRIRDYVISRAHYLQQERAEAKAE